MKIRSTPTALQTHASAEARPTSSARATTAASPADAAPATTDLPAPQGWAATMQRLPPTLQRALASPLRTVRAASLAVLAGATVLPPGVAFGAGACSAFVPPSAPPDAPSSFVLERELHQAEAKLPRLAARLTKHRPKRMAGYVLPDFQAMEALLAQSETPTDTRLADGAGRLLWDQLQKAQADFRAHAPVISPENATRQARAVRHLIHALRHPAPVGMFGGGSYRPDPRPVTEQDAENMIAAARRFWPVPGERVARVIARDVMPFVDGPETQALLQSFIDEAHWVPARPLSIGTPAPAEVVPTTAYLDDKGRVISPMTSTGPGQVWTMPVIRDSQLAGAIMYADGYAAWGKVGGWTDGQFNMPKFRGKNEPFGPLQASGAALTGLDAPPELQRGYGVNADGSLRSFAQVAGDKFGVYLDVNDTAPGQDQMTITPTYYLSTKFAPFAQPGELSFSFDFQAPVVSGDSKFDMWHGPKSASYVMLYVGFKDPVGRNLLVGWRLADSRANVSDTDIGFDPVTQSLFVTESPRDGMQFGKLGPRSAIFQGGSRPYAVAFDLRLGPEQMKAAIAAANQQITNGAAPFSVNPADYTLVTVGFNPEQSRVPGSNAPAKLGMSVGGFTVGVGCD